MVTKSPQERLKQTGEILPTEIKYCLIGTQIKKDFGPTSDLFSMHLQSCALCRRALNEEFPMKQ